MALPNLTGQNIQDTYQRILQTDGTIIYNGTGSVFIPATASYALTASYAISASHEITYELSSSYAETASFIANGVHDLTSGEVTQLKNINTHAISNAEWGYVAGGQAHGTTDSPTFSRCGVDSYFQHRETSPGPDRPTITSNALDTGMYLGLPPTLMGFIFEGTEKATLDTDGDLTLRQITASGDISSSGNIIGIINGGTF